MGASAHRLYALPQGVVRDPTEFSKLKRLTTHLRFGTFAPAMSQVALNCLAMRAGSSSYQWARTIQTWAAANPLREKSPALSSAPLLFAGAALFV
jgi:hypothetical protein